MSLRPRYSLLTLLLLTAAVAGGIKFWRGPHWAELHDPPTREERAILEQHSALWKFISDYSAIKVQFQFMREGQGNIWHLIEGRNFQYHSVLIALPPRHLEFPYPVQMLPRIDWQPIVYWIASVEANSEEDSLYLLGEDLNVYRLQLSPWGGLVSIALHQIDNSAVRGRLAEEIEKLHVKQAEGPATK